MPFRRLRARRRLRRLIVELDRAAALAGPALRPLPAAARRPSARA